MNKKHCNTLLPLVQLLPAVAAAAAVIFALPRTVPVLAAVPERLAVVMEQPVEAASVEAEEEALPKLPYADGVYVGSSRGYGGAVRVQVTMENGSITEVEILDASHETKQFLRRAKRLLTTVVDTQSWEVDAVSEATYTSRGILGAVQNALTGEVVNNPLPPQPKPAALLVVEEFTAPSTYLDGIYTAEAIGFEGKITVQVTVAEDKITDITVLSAEDEEEYLARAKRVIPAILEGQSPNVDAVSGATYSSTGILNAVKLALAKAAVAPAEETGSEDAGASAGKSCCHTSLNHAETVLFSSGCTTSTVGAVTGVSSGPAASDGAVSSAVSSDAVCSGAVFSAGATAAFASASLTAFRIPVEE